MHRFIARACIAVSLALLAGACGDNTPTTPISPTLPATVVETFAGTLTRNGAVTHTFTSASAGSVQASLTSLTPNNGLPVGLSIGTWNGATCAIVLANDQALQTSTVIGTVSSVGSLCVRIYDVGNVTEPTSYEVLVTHP